MLTLYAANKTDVSDRHVIDTDPHATIAELWMLAVHGVAHGRWLWASVDNTEDDTSYHVEERCDGVGLNVSAWHTGRDGVIGHTVHYADREQFCDTADVPPLPTL